MFLTALGVDNALILNFRHDAPRFISFKLSGTKPPLWPVVAVDVKVRCKLGKVMVSLEWLLMDDYNEKKCYYSLKSVREMIIYSICIIIIFAFFLAFPPWVHNLRYGTGYHNNILCTCALRTMSSMILYSYLLVLIFAKASDSFHSVFYVC